LLERGTEIEKQAAALALPPPRMPVRRMLLSSHPALAEAVRAGRLDWESLAMAGT
jgi:hypothetical protein